MVNFNLDHYEWPVYCLYRNRLDRTRNILGHQTTSDNKADPRGKNKKLIGKKRLIRKLTLTPFTLCSNVACWFILFNAWSETVFSFIHLVFL